jgi:hypothetical protein
MSESSKANMTSGFDSVIKMCDASGVYARFKLSIGLLGSLRLPITAVAGTK